MAHQRAPSMSTSEVPKEPHAVSLKVLRLTRPSLAIQYPLSHPSPTSTLAQSIPRAASLTYPSAPSSPFALSPLLTLPPAFGNAYVGETFSCTLCANNELPTDAPRVHSVKIEAEMKTPSLTTTLPVSFASSSTPSSPASDPLSQSAPPSTDLAPAASQQGIITCHLREEGPHVLAVTVSYSETTATSGRVRSFRKLYQFVARPALVVRTKVGTVDGGWALEAQLENVGEEALVLEGVRLDTKSWFRARSLESLWDGEKGEKGKAVVGRGGIQQVCFVVEKVGEPDEIGEGGKVFMGVLNISWRGPMGNMGELSTGWLGLKLKS
ncbi:hypothetical protein V494_07434 [Pseudogymnoascus sp. VKM F-4513 (FW-928)]|nr:hypothetical protein V494_07434 [Pseudogymnoascus sp. VKM F-4513 (FW-928)]